MVESNSRAVLVTDASPSKKITQGCPETAHLKRYLNLQDTEAHEKRLMIELEPFHFGAVEL